MAIYHFTLHAYRSWRPDHSRGYTKKGAGYQPPNSEVADQYDNAATQEAVIFISEIQKVILAITHEICEKENWQLKLAAFDKTHTHLVLGWREFNSWEEVDRRLKNLLVLKLNRRYETPGKRWFVRRHSAPRRVRNAEHLKYLEEIYFPNHAGIFWKRGMSLPMLA